MVITFQVPFKDCQGWFMCGVTEQDAYSLSRFSTKNTHNLTYILRVITFIHGSLQNHHVIYLTVSKTVVFAKNISYLQFPYNQK